MHREQLANIYIDWLNNYITIPKFAEHHGLTEVEAEMLLYAAKSAHTNPHPEA